MDFTSSHLILKKYVKILFFALFFLKFCNVQSQEINLYDTFYKTISFGNKVFFGEIERNATWKIVNPNGNKITLLKGNEINDFIFSELGVYNVNFTDVKNFGPNECSHPKFKNIMLINVTSTEMKFDFSKIKFSDKIMVGKRCDDIIVTLPITIRSFSEVSKIKLSNVNVTGNDVNLIAIPVQEEIVVKNGTTYNLSYKLSGIVNKETYLMFDFIDNNNETQTYYQLEIVN